MIPLMLLAVLNAFSGSAFSHTPTHQDLDSRDYDYLQADQNTNALFFGEFSSTTTISFLEKYPSGNGSFFLGSYTYSSASAENSNLEYADYLQDRRKDLEHHIFPFHFFW